MTDEQLKREAELKYKIEEKEKFINQFNQAMSEGKETMLCYIQNNRCVKIRPMTIVELEIEKERLNRELNQFKQEYINL